MMKFSAIVSHKGETNEVEKLLISLLNQSEPVFEVIIINQNTKNDLKNLAAHYSNKFSSFKYFHKPNQSGVCKGRNYGINQMSGEFCFFPDDTSHYPKYFVERSINNFKNQKCDILTGRLVNEKIISINGRFNTQSEYLNRKNVFNSQIEATMIFKKKVIQELYFDEVLGPGSGTILGSAEGIDLLLRALDKKYKAYYDTDIYSFHPEIILKKPGKFLITKLHHYGVGFGYVLKKNRYNFLYLLYWAIRPLGNIPVDLIKNDLKLVYLRIMISFGRFKGYFLSI